MPIMQGIVYPNALPVNGDLQTYQVSGGAINAGEFVQFSDTVSLGTRTEVGNSTTLSSGPDVVKLNETDILAFSGTYAVIVRFSASGITTGAQVSLVSDSFTTISSAVLLDTNLVLVGLSYAATSGSSRQSGSKAIVLSINGLQITPYAIQNGYLVSTSSVYSDLYVSVVPVSTTSGLLITSYIRDQYNNVESYINIINCTSTGFTVSAAQSIPTTMTSRGGFLKSGVPLGQGKVLLCTSYAVIATVEGSTLSFGSPQNIGVYDSYFPFLNGSTGLLLTNNGSNTSSGYVNARAFYVSGNTLNIGSQVQISTSTYNSKYFPMDCVFLSGSQAIVSCNGSACIVNISDDLTITAGTWTQILSAGSMSAPCRMVATPQNTAIFLGSNANASVISGTTITAGTNVALAAATYDGVFLPSLNLVAAFDYSIGDIYATPISMLVMPYETVAFGVAKTDGAVGDTITIYLPPSS